MGKTKTAGKRLLSAALALVMTLSLLPFSALAAQPEQTAQTDTDALEEAYLKQYLEEQVTYRLEPELLNTVEPTVPDLNDTLEVASIGGKPVTTDGVLTVDGYGKKIPVVNAGNYGDYFFGAGMNQLLPLTVSRPAGDSAQYPVSVDVRAVSGSFTVRGTELYRENDAQNADAELPRITLDAGEKQTTVYLNITFGSDGNQGIGAGSFYLQFYNAHRTAIDYPMIQVLLNRPAPETQPEAFTAGTNFGVSLPSDGVVMGLPLPVTVSMSAPDNFIAAADSSLTLGGLTLAPQEPAGAAGQQISFLYMPTPDDIASNASYDGAGLTLEGKWGTLQLKDHVSGAVVNMGQDYSIGNISIRSARPEYGALKTDKETYAQNEQVTVTIPIENAALLETTGQFPLGDLAPWFFLTLDGTKPVAATAAYASNAITATFNAPDAAGTYYAEVIESEVSEENPNVKIDTIPYGAFVAFTVNNDVSNFVPVESVTIGNLPENNRLDLEQAAAHRLTATVTPESATFKNVVWSSSDPAVLEVNANGEITGKKTGVATVTATVQGEVTYWEQKGQTPPLDKLTATAAIMVGEVSPRIYSGSHSMAAGRSSILFNFSDNFAKAIPAAQKEEILGALKYKVEVFTKQSETNRNTGETDWNEAAAVTQTDIPLSAGPNDAPYQVYKNPNTENRTLYLNRNRIENFPKAVSAYKYNNVNGRVELEPAYKITLTATFHDSFLNNVTTAADFFVYVSPSGVYCDGLPFAGHQVLAKRQTPAWGSSAFLRNVSPQFTRVGYELSGPTQRTAEVTGNTVRAASGSYSDDHFSFTKNEETGEYTAEIRPNLTGIDKLDIGFYTIRFYMVDENLRQTYEQVITFEIRDVRSAVSMTLNGKSPSEMVTADSLNTKYKAFTDETGSKQAKYESYVKAVLSYTPLVRGHLEYHPSFGQPQVKVTYSKNGKTETQTASLTGGDFTLLTPDNGHKVDIEVTWPGLTGQSLTASYVNAAANHAVIEVPESCREKDLKVYHYPDGHQTNIAGGDATIKPVDGKLAFPLDRIKGHLRISYEDGGNTYSAVLPRASLKFARWSGTPGDTAILADGVTANPIPAAALETNYAAFQKAVKITFNVPDSQKFVAAIDDGTGNLIAANSHEVDCAPLLANPDSKLVVEAIYDLGGKKVPSVEIYDLARLRELTNNFQRADASVTLYPPISLQMARRYDGFLGQCYASSSDTAYFDLRQGLDGPAFALKGDGREMLHLAVPTDMFPGVSAKKILAGGQAPREAETLETGNDALQHSYHLLTYDMASVLPLERDPYGFGRRYDHITLSAGGVSKECPVHVTTHDEGSIILYNEMNAAIPQLDGVSFAPVKGVESKSRSSVNGIIGEASDIFDNFSVNLPTNTPFTFNITKQGNEYIIKGVVEVSVLPDGGFAETLSGLGEMGEEAFNHVYDRIRESVDDAQDNGTVKDGFQINTGGEAFVGVRGYLSARGYYDPGTRQVKIEFNDGGLVGEISAAMRINTPLAFGQVAFKFDFSTTAGMYITMPTNKELALLKDPNALRANFDLRTETSLGMDAKIGAGINVFIIKICAGVGGNFRLGAETSHITRPYADLDSDGVHFSGKAEVYFYASVGVLFFEYEKRWRLFGGGVDLYEPNNKTNPFHPDYQFSLQEEPARLRANAMPRALLNQDAVSGQNKQMIRDRLNRSSGAGLYGNGLTLYVAPDEDYNQYRLTGNGTVISDTAGQFGFHSATNASDTTLAVWEEIPQDITLDGSDDENAAMMSYLDKTEIHAAFWNGSAWGTVAELSGNDRMDISPKAAINSRGDAVVVWSRGNPQNTNAQDIDGLTGSGELVYARYDGTKWVSGMTISPISAEKPFADYSVALDDSGNALVAASYQNSESLGQIEYFYIEKGSLDLENNKLETIRTYRSAQNGLNPQVAWTDYIGFQTAFYSGEKSEETSETGMDDALYYGVFKPESGASAQRLAVNVPVTSALRLAPAAGGAVLAWTATATNEDTAENRLYAARVTHVPDASYYVSPARQLGAAPYLIPAFELQMKDDTLTAAALFYDNSENIRSASLYTFSADFANAASASAVFDRSLMSPGAELPITYTIENQGHQEITEVQISGIGDPPKTFSGLTLKPGQRQSFTVYYKLPEALTELTTNLTATFAGNGTVSTQVKLALPAADLALDFVPAQQENAPTLSVEERSGFAPPNGANVTVGLYEDGQGSKAIGEPVVLTEEELTNLKNGKAVAKTFTSLPTGENAAVFALVTLESASVSVFELDPVNNAATRVLNPKDKQPAPSGSSGGGGGGSAGAKLNVTTASFDVNPDGAGHKDLVFTLSAGGYKLSQLLLDGKALEEGKDYTVDGQTYKFTAAFLSKLSVGQHRLTFDMSGDTDPEATLEIKDSRLSCWENPFTDVRQADWFYGAVQYVHQNGLFSGTDAQTFSPGEQMTRAMLVTVLHRLAGSPAPKGENPFTDVKPGSWYADAVVWAAENGIVGGYGGGRFGPGDPVTREQLAAILHRYAGSPAASGTLDGFTDAAQAGRYAEDALRWAVAQGILTGKGGGVLDPKGSATRAEAAAMLMRFQSNT